MSNKAASIGSAVAGFRAARGIPDEMEQNLIKETIHLHLLSALSDAGVLRHVVFQGGTALHLCYGGERYSEDLDFVCGKAGTYIANVAFEQFVQDALEATKKSLHRDFGIDPGEIALKQPANPMGIKADHVSVAAWQIIVPVGTTSRSPKSRIKIEFANVPSHDRTPAVARAMPGLTQVQDIILTVESANEILADKAVALTAREALKYRDVWDVWFLVSRLGADTDPEIVARKFSDYGTADVLAKAERRREELAQATTEKPFLDEMRRFLPTRRIADLGEAGLHRTMLAMSGELLRRAVLR
jgi:predicted nucleotidyltransferase component of viral defense system